MEPLPEFKNSESAYEEISVKDAWISLFDNPLVGILSSLFIPACIIGYSLWAMKITPNMAGVLDHLLFILLFYLVFNSLLSLTSAFRILLSFGFVMAVAMFFLSNTLYFRFFNSWGQIDTAKMWRDVPSLWNGIVTLAQPLDYLFGFIIPLFLWQFSLRSYLLLTWKHTLVLISFLVLIFSAHMLISQNQLNYMENNPFFYMLREKKLQMSLEMPEGKIKITKDLNQYQLVNESLYEKSKDDAFPFFKTPKPDIKPLPFAVASKPNIVLVLMESVRAHEIGAYGANPSFMPNLDRIAKEGFLFKNFYAIATQTIRAEFCIHSSFNPDVLGGPVYVNNPSLSVLTLPMVLKNHGYKTIWMEAECGSFTKRKIQFLSKHGVDAFHVDVPKVHPALGLGAADEDTFQYASDVFSKEKGPFFAEIMTLSNHWTFNADYPTKPQTPRAEGNSDYRDYTSGIFYTDYALGKFIENAKKTEWGQNTIFVITGDHGIWYFPEKPGYDNIIRKKEVYFRSPLVIWSANRRLISPKVINTLGSHLDITPSLLDLLNIHDPNPFIGTSLFRDDTGTRFVVTIQDGRWNIRYGNEYAYDVGPEIFASLPPFNLQTYLKEVRGKEMKYAYFSTDQDLLQSWDSSRVDTLNPKRSTELKKFGQSVVDAFHAVILKNQIYKPEK